MAAEDCDNFDEDLPSDCRSRVFSFNFIGREDDMSLPYHNCDDMGNGLYLTCSLTGNRLCTLSDMKAATLLSSHFYLSFM